ncbi:MAG: ribulose-phosphate 3-epimerase, partial [Fimbriimonadaceae bacterium]|nr:ribulose-phosphate 3-epimerase [Fimbriimonadaceae bacterium]
MSCRIAPSILSFDHSRLRDAVAQLASAGAERIHFDVMDGQFVPPITFGDGLVSALRDAADLTFEAHLMTQTPERHFEAFAKAGCARIYFHAESTVHAHRLVQTLRKLGVEPALAINPATPVAEVEP